MINQQISGVGVTVSFWIVLIVYLFILVLFGIYSKKRTKSVEDYLIAGRSIGPVLLGLSFGVTYFSSVLLIGGGGLAAVWGLGSIWIAAIDVLVGVLLVFVFFGRRTKILADKSRSVTVPQLIGYRYQDRNYQVFSGAVVMIFEMIYLVSIYMGLSKLLTLLTPENFANQTYQVMGTEVSGADISYVIGVTLCAGITIIYLVSGGAFGAILSDAIESLIMLCGVVLICVFGLIAVGGLSGMMEGLRNAESPATANPFSEGDLTTFIGFGGMGILGYILVTSFGMWGMPQAIARFFTAKAKKTIKYGVLIACIWASVVAFFAWFNGALAASYWWKDPDANSDAIAAIYGGDLDMNIPIFLSVALPPALAAIFIAGVTAASMTTGEKVILISASGFAQDVYQNLMERKKAKIPDDKMLKITRIVTAFIVAGGLLLALTKPDLVLALCMFAWSAMASTILVPYVFGLFWKKATSKAAWVSGVVALVVAVLWWLIFRWKEPSIATVDWIYNARSTVLLDPSKGAPFAATLGDFYTGNDPTARFVKTGVHEFIVSQVVAFITFPIVSVLTKPPNKEFLDDVFKSFEIKKKIKAVEKKSK
ncbi:MAG: sodium:solute symporter family transporter [Promethearchaeota archaeon]